MNLHIRLRRLEQQAEIHPPDPTPEAIRELLPGLAHLDQDQRQRVLLKEWDRMELRMAFVGHVMPGVFTLDFSPEEVEHAVQAMLDAAYPDTLAPRDVAAGNIEEVARQKWDAVNRDMYDRRVSFGQDNTPGTESLLEPTTGDLLDQAARGGRHWGAANFSFGLRWEMPAPWIDFGGTQDCERELAGIRPIRGLRRRP